MNRNEYAEFRDTLDDLDEVDLARAGVREAERAAAMSCVGPRDRLTQIGLKVHDRPLSATYVSSGWFAM